MNVRKINLALWSLTGVLAAGGIVALGMGVLAPVEVEEPVVARGGGHVATSQASPDARLGVDAFERIAAMQLRKPLNGAAGAATTTNSQMTEQNPAAGGGGAPFALVGTIGQSLAMIQTAGGAIEIKGVGELANGARIVAIRPWQVDVEVGGVKQTIAKARPPGVGDGGGRFLRAVRGG
jgi:hypothetical protein